MDAGASRARGPALWAGVRTLLGEWDYKPPKRRGLRERDEDALLEQFGVTVERLLQILYEPPKLVGDFEWTQATLRASQEIAQVYAELKRRSKAMQARALLREELRRFVEWRRESVVSAGD